MSNINTRNRSEVANIRDHSWRVTEAFISHAFWPVMYFSCVSILRKKCSGLFSMCTVTEQRAAVWNCTLTARHIRGKYWGITEAVVVNPFPCSSQVLCRGSGEMSSVLDTFKKDRAEGIYRHVQPGTAARKAARKYVRVLKWSGKWNGTVLITCLLEHKRVPQFSVFLLLLLLYCAVASYIRQ